MNVPLFTSPPRLYEPGLNALPANTERYVVRAHGSLTLGLDAGDEIELINPEGLQRCEISVFDSDGNSDMQTIGARADGRAEGLKSILTEFGVSADKLFKALKYISLSIYFILLCYSFFKTPNPS